ncbi:hypothetical protein LSM04_006947 [Trypanosoma melophagium]|uniref:uncharacterized protein n=1 Tax=Trypanosoma melophagium TaxID=715481 RepID=UPI00351A512B|nr:hypothetical protein LSM04_006947 [Trypanosoma melophagium]
MRRLYRLIEKKVTHRQNTENENAFQRHLPRRGSLIINKKENDHLEFLDNLPNIILLRGSTTLADVINVNRLPSKSNNDGNNDSGGTAVDKRERKSSSRFVDYSIPTNIPPITYIQGPSILYQDP